MNIVEYKFNNTVGDLFPTFNTGYQYTYTDTVNGESTVRLISSDSLPTQISFQGASALTDILYMNTSELTTMKSMFYNCKSLTSIDTSNWDTSKVEDMNGMFASCTNLTSLDLSNFDTSNVTDMTSIFNDCSSLKHIGMLYCDYNSVNTVKNLLTSSVSIYVKDVLASDFAVDDTAIVKDYVINTSTIVLNSPLHKWDVLEVVDGRVYHVHNTKEIIFDGSESTWSVFADGTSLANQYYIPVADALHDANMKNAISDKYPSYTINARTSHYNIVYTYNGGIAFNIDKKLISKDLPEEERRNRWCEYLKSNPITVLYYCKEPIREDITDIQIQNEEERPAWLLKGVQEGVFDIDTDFTLMVNITYSNNIVSYTELYEQINQIQSDATTINNVFNEEVDR